MEIALETKGIKLIPNLDGVSNPSSVSAQAGRVRPIVSKLVAKRAGGRLLLISFNFRRNV